MKWAAAALLCFFMQGALGSGLHEEAVGGTQAYSVELLAKAQPDECFHGVGEPYTSPPCASGKPKTNQAYLWSMTASDQSLWFGTAANPLCGAGAKAETGVNALPIVGEPRAGPLWVCEKQASSFAPPNPLVSPDWRSPRIFRFSRRDGHLEEHTPADPRISEVSGIRAAASQNHLVLLGGPGLPGNEPGVRFFLFGDSGEFLGSHTDPSINNIRQWVRAGKYLYLGAQSADGGDGVILRWDADPRHPFAFTVVGKLPAEAANITLHEGRLFATTWPDIPAYEEVQHFSGGALYMSPPLQEGGLLAEDVQNQWQKVWQAEDYEPDPVVGYTYGGGALASFDGWLYWGTMHIFGTGLEAFELTYGKRGGLEKPLAASLTRRPASLFRGRGFGDKLEIEVLYGFSHAPTFKPIKRDRRGIVRGVWTIAPNGMGKPLWGRAGFGNPWNGYVWSMAVWNNTLFWGTMDASYHVRATLQVAALEIPRLLGMPTFMFPPPATLKKDYGADLFALKGSDGPAVAITTDGLGDPGNFGFRSMEATPEGLYLGTANPYNLLYDPQDPLKSGGWELWRLGMQAAEESGM